MKTRVFPAIAKPFCAISFSFIKSDSTPNWEEEGFFFSKRNVQKKREMVQKRTFPDLHLREREQETKISRGKSLEDSPLRACARALRASQVLFSVLLLVAAALTVVPIQVGASPPPRALDQTDETPHPNPLEVVIVVVVARGKKKQQQHWRKTIWI